MRAGFLLAAGKVSISPPAAMMRAASRPPVLTTKARPPALTIASVTSTVVTSAPPASKLGTIWAMVGRASGKGAVSSRRTCKPRAGSSTRVPASARAARGGAAAGREPNPEPGPESGAEPGPEQDPEPNPERVQNPTPGPVQPQCIPLQPGAKRLQGPMQTVGKPRVNRAQ